MSITVYAPASIGNVGVGFDLLGAALAPIDSSLFGDCVSIEAGDSAIEFACQGPWQHKLPSDPDANIVSQCARYFVGQLAEHLRPAGLKITLSKNLPVGSGLGSSASSVVSAFAALNEYFCRPFNNEQLLLMMGEFEGRVSGSVHYDNVAPAFLGGMQLLVLTANRVCEPVPFFKEWLWVVAYPGISLSTAHMRAMLPEKYTRATTIEYGRNLGVFIQASFRNDQQLAVAVLKDVLAEPWRCSSIPGFSKARTAMTDIGMLATGISGSGPTIFSVTDSPDRAEQARIWLEDNFMQSREGFTRICQLDKSGARIIAPMPGTRKATPVSS